MNVLRILIAFISLIMAACASQEPKPPKTQEFFTTQIKRDGVKQFRYTMTVEMEKSPKRIGKGAGPRGGHGGPPPRGRDGQKNDKRSAEEMAMEDSFNFTFNESLVAKLSDTGYCQQGYKQVDKKSRRGVIQLAGECNDKASETDYIKFPNPPPKKVKEEIIE